MVSTVFGGEVRVVLFGGSHLREDGTDNTPYLDEIAARERVVAFMPAARITFAGDLRDSGDWSIEVLEEWASTLEEEFFVDQVPVVLLFGADYLWRLFEVLVRRKHEISYLNGHQEICLFTFTGGSSACDAWVDAWSNLGLAISDTRELPYVFNVNEKGYAGEAQLHLPSAEKTAGGASVYTQRYLGSFYSVTTGELVE